MRRSQDAISQRARVILFSLGFAATCFNASCATYVWDGGGSNNNLTTASNWAGNAASPFNYAPAATADTLIFAGSSRLTPANDTLSGETNGQTAFTLTFAADAGPFVIGGNKMTLGSTTGTGGSGGSISNLSAQTQTFDCEVAPRSGVILAQGGGLVFNDWFHLGNGANNRTNIFDGPFDIRLNGQATSKGAVLKRGSGTLFLLNANNDFIGPVTVTGGTLSLGAAGSLAATPAITIGHSGRLDVAGLPDGFQLAASQSLSGEGLVTGKVVVVSSAVLSSGPGSGVGSLTIHGDLVLEGDHNVRWRKTGGALTNDSIRGLRSAKLSGSLILTNIGTEAVTAGDTLQLYHADICSGIFASITPPVPGAGLVWDLSRLASGFLGVASAPRVSAVTSRPDKSVDLSLSGPLKQSYEVLASTNPVLPLSAWQPVASGFLTQSPFAWTDFGAASFPRRFYRLASTAYTRLPGPFTVMSATSPTATWRPYSTRTLDCLPMVLQAGQDSGFSTFGGLFARQTNATGYFYPRKVGDRWWLIDPSGYFFLHRGVAAISTLSTTGATAALQSKFGTTANWAAATTSLLRQHAFNGAGAWSDTTRLRAINPPLVYTRIWNFMSTYSKTNTGPGYPYVFDTNFLSFSDGFAKQLGGQKTDPWLLGHFSDNELAFPSSMLTNFLSLPPGNESGDAAWNWLRIRYGTNANPGQVTEQDKRDFLGHAWGRYYQVVSQAIKRYDSNHLYLGSRFYSSDKDRPEIFRAIAPYVDVISVNHYSQWTPDIERIRMWERESGRPVLITEWYVKGEDSGMGNTTGAGWVVQTQQERGHFYENFALALLQSKVCVGWHWFKYADNDPDDTNADPSNIDSNKGIVSNRYDPYYDLLDSAKRINERAHRLTDFFDGAVVP